MMKTYSRPQTAKYPAGSENYIGTQNRRNGASKTSGTGSNPVAPAKEKYREDFYASLFIVFWPKSINLSIVFFYNSVREKRKFF
jgi:hypothetical protein